MPEMKDSGIEWIGEIPAKWIQCRLKDVCLGFSNGSSVTQIPSGDTEYPVTRIETISKGYIDMEKVGYVERIPSQYKLNKDDILVSNINSIAYLGNCAMYEGSPDLYHGMNLMRVIPNNIYARFLYYYLKSFCFRTGMQIVCKPAINQASVSATNMKNLPIVVPETKKQRKIATFLDSKCSEIDALLADIQSEIEILEEYKKSVITEAVTKGLNPEVNMKASGIEYVGDIPSSWEIHPVYYYFGERKAKNYALKEQNLLSLSYGKIIRKDINTNGGLLPASFNTYNIVEAGDIIIRPTDLQNDKRSLRTGLVTEHGIITSAYIDLMPIGDINSEYFHYLLHAFDVMKVFYNMGNGVRQGLNYSEFSKLMIFAPSRKEQDDIVAYLKDKCSAIEESIALKKEQLETLEEYKKSVIYEYVTGKKEVPLS